MSWSISGKTSLGKLRQGNFEDLTASPQVGHGEAECAEIMEATRDAVAIVAHHLGEGPCQVTISGHANPNHEPAEGWSRDMITITVSQAAGA